MKSSLLAIVLLLLTSCAQSGRTEIELPAQTAAQDIRDLKSPLNIAVKEAYQEKDRLHVQATVVVAADISAENAVVGIVGLKDGEEIARQFIKLSQLAQTSQLKSGQTLEVPLQLAASDISEFQLRCLWGEEASAVLATIAGETARASLSRDVKSPAEEVDPVARIISQSDRNKTNEKNSSIKLTINKIREKQVECKIKPCDILFTVIAELENNGSSNIDTAKIAVGLYWANAGAMPLVPVDGAKLRDSEQELTLNGLDLAPGEKKQLEVKVDQPVPPLRGGGFVPHVRLLSIVE